MRSRHQRARSVALHIARLIVTVTAACGATQPATAQAVAVDELLSGVVRIKTFINPDGRTIANLGREREGTGVVISADGLVLTIGYLMVEAQSAEIVDNTGRQVAADIVGYDHETGFGLLRASRAQGLRPMPLGKSADLTVGEKVLVAGGGGLASVGPATLAARRPFAGSWEYLLEDALFTTPAFPWWSGAALVSRDGQLVGIGSLAVPDAPGRGKGEAGNMFVPIDRLPPILADLIADGKVSTPAKPWLGINTSEKGGRLVIDRVTPGGPAEKAGVAAGDVIERVGPAQPRTLAELYRAIWATGAAGATVDLGLARKDGGSSSLAIKSMNRLDHLKLGSSF